MIGWGELQVVCRQRKKGLHRTNTANLPDIDKETKIARILDRSLLLGSPYHGAKREVRLCDETALLQEDMALCDDTRARDLCIKMTMPINRFTQLFPCEEGLLV